MLRYRSLTISWYLWNNIQRWITNSELCSYERYSETDD